jgi:DNA-binding transcriptional LysR family regulator
MLKVAEERSFSKAAQKLYIAQPSLSQFIQKLEQQLGIELFDRSSTPLKLTYAGELYVETAKRILDLNDQLSQQMEDAANSKRGRLTIGLSPFRSAYVLPKVLPLFQERFPGIEIALIEGTSTELEELTLKGATDICIMALPIEDKLFSYEPILTEEILIVLPPNHFLHNKFNIDFNNKNHRPSLNLKLLSEEPFIMLKQNQKLRQIAANLCKQAGFKPKVVLESKSIETVHALAIAGIGITLIPDTLTWSLHKQTYQMYYSIEELHARRTLVAAYRKGRYLSIAAREFIEIMKDILN